MMGMVALAATLMQPLAPAQAPHLKQVAQRTATMSVGIFIVPRSQGTIGTRGAAPSRTQFAAPAARTTLIREGGNTIILRYN